MPKGSYLDKWNANARSLAIGLGIFSALVVVLIVPQDPRQGWSAVGLAALVLGGYSLGLYVKHKAESR